MPSTIDITGMVFGRLTAKSLTQSDGKQRYWVCMCACGATVKIRAASLKNGHSKSCGCLHKEKSSRQLWKHGASSPGRRSPEYGVWASMNSRCADPSNARFERYGGRGITVCERWRHDYAAFLADMGPRPSKGHSIDRIDNDGIYEPGNVRWATAAQQMRNTSRSANVTAFGETMCITDWSGRFGVCDETIRNRLKSGVNPEQAVTEPVRRPGESMADYRIRLSPSR